MPKDPRIKKVLVIGSGPIIIGQAAEFDYSGTQACRALKAEGIETVLLNSNPATIMTDPKTADATYIEPITWETVARIIEKERPDAILPTMGGQTALNCAMDLDEFFDMFDITDETDSSTLNGWVMEHLGRIPDVGDKFNAHGLEITIKAADGRRVNEINVVHTPVKPEKGTK